MDTYIEFCIRFWEATRELDLYSMDGSQLDRLIVDALLKTNGGKELIKTSMNELSVLIRAFNHNNKKIQQPPLPSNLDEAAEEFGKRQGIELAPFAKKFFKRGAEWMAGQGETQEHFIVGSITDSPCGPAVVCYTEDFEVGDKVIVQIRKKH